MRRAIYPRRQSIGNKVAFYFIQKDARAGQGALCKYHGGGQFFPAAMVFKYKQPKTGTVPIKQNRYPLEEQKI